MSFSFPELPQLGPIELAIILATIGLLMIIGLVIRHRNFIKSLKSSLKIDIKKLAKKNQPVETQSGWAFTIVLMSYIPFSLLIFSPVLQLTMANFVIITVILIVLVLFGMFGQHMLIADSYTSKTNLLAFVRYIGGWNLVFFGRRVVRSIVLPQEKLNEVKATSIKYSESDTKISAEVQEFWKAPKIYAVLLQKYVNSMRDAIVVVTDIPWTEAVGTETMQISAGIKTIEISVGCAMLTYTPAIEMMSSEEHKKYLKIDKVEVPIFTSIFTNLSAEAQKNIAAAALDGMRASDERTRRENAEADNNILRERIAQLQKDRKIQKRLDENSRLSGLTTSEPTSRIKVVKKYKFHIALAITIGIAALFGLLLIFR